MKDLKYPFVDVMNERYTQNAGNNCVNKSRCSTSKVKPQIQGVFVGVMNE
jgi:hypothetical protein